VVVPTPCSHVVILPLTMHAPLPFLYIHTATSVAPGLFLRDSGRACPVVVPPRGCSVAGAVGAERVGEPGTVRARGRKKGGRGGEVSDVEVVKSACCSNEWKGRKKGKGGRKTRQSLSRSHLDNTIRPQTQLGALPRRRLLLRRVERHAFLAPPSLPPSCPASRACSSCPG